MFHGSIVRIDYIRCNKVATARFPNIFIELGSSNDEFRVFVFSFFFSMLVFSKSSNKEQQLQKHIVSSTKVGDESHRMASEGGCEKEALLLIVDNH